MNEHVFAPAEDGGLRFIGDFDGLYAEEIDPWGQSGNEPSSSAYYAASRRRLITGLRRHAPATGRVLEVGCGHGHAMAILQEAEPRMQWTGLDISTKALAYARERYPGTRFIQGDITRWCPANLGGTFDAVILNQVLWYILERLDDALANCSALVKTGGLVILSQAFLKAPQRYGAHICDGFAGALAQLAGRFTVIEARYDTDSRLVHYDGLIVCRC